MKALMLATAMTLAAAPAFAAMECADTATVERNLKERYGETLVWQGLDGNGMLPQIWGNRDTGSWTLILMRPDGQSCLVSSGMVFETPAAAIRGVGPEMDG